MLRFSPLLLFLAMRSDCMEMHETVERTVMVRTTGSDLQPAATGFIYKRENDGKEKVVKIDTVEVMKHLSKMYEQPQAFKAPIPVGAGPFHASEDSVKAPSNNKERVIPVKEIDSEVDGIADEDDRDIFKDNKGGHNADSIKNYGQKYDHGLPLKYDGKQNIDDWLKDYKINRQYGNGGAGNYHSEKIETNKGSGSKNNKQDSHDDHPKYNHDNSENQYKDEGRSGFQKFYTDQKDFYNDDSFRKVFQKFGNHDESDRHTKRDLHEAGDEEYLPQISEYTSEFDEQGRETFDDDEFPGDEGLFGAKIDEYSKSYSYAIKH